jgi:CBS-domain-containing membrane protein
VSSIVWRGEKAVRPVDLTVLRLARPRWQLAVRAGLGGCLAIAVLALADQESNAPLLAAAFGSTSVLAFLTPELPFSQPANVVGGHVAATLCGLACAAILPTTWWSIGLSVGLAITVMSLLRVTHPPAGGNPVIVMTTPCVVLSVPAHIGWRFLPSAIQARTCTLPLLVHPSASSRS